MGSGLWRDRPWRETGASLPWREVLAEASDYVVMLTGFVVYSAGLVFEVDVRVSSTSVLADPLGIMKPVPLGASLQELEADPFVRSFAVVAGSSAASPAGESVESGPTEPTACFRHGNGDQNSWTEWWWLGPLPTTDTLELTATWGSGAELSSAAVQFDAHELRAAAARSRLWGHAGK